MTRNQEVVGSNLATVETIYYASSMDQFKVQNIISEKKINHLKMEGWKSTNRRVTIWTKWQENVILLKVRSKTRVPKTYSITNFTTYLEWVFSNLITTFYWRNVNLKFDFLIIQNDWHQMKNCWERECPLKNVASTIGQWKVESGELAFKQKGKTTKSNLLTCALSKPKAHTSRKNKTKNVNYGMN